MVQVEDLMKKKQYALKTELKDKLGSPRQPEDEEAEMEVHPQLTFFNSRPR